MKKEEKTYSGKGNLIYLLHPILNFALCKIGFSSINGEMKELFATNDFSISDVAGIKISLFAEVNVHKSLYIEPKISYVDKGFRANYNTVKEEITSYYKNNFKF